MLTPCQVFGFAVVCGVLHWHVELLALVTPLGWVDAFFLEWAHSRGIMANMTCHAPPLGVLFVRGKRLDLSQLRQYRFLDIHATCSYPEDLL